jgi:broad specificity phosphatase PhoE
VPADLIHLVRHGEVFNPDRVLYGRLPGFGLSGIGHEMAQAAADSLAGHPITRLVASPLQRTVESAQPWANGFKLDIHLDERIIEPTNRFEGMRVRIPQTVLQPKVWPWLVNPTKPSWGEPFASIAARMLAAIEDHWQQTESGELVMVSHQAPIWISHLAIGGRRLFHNPSRRRCTLSSITSFKREGDRFVEVSYAEPAAHLLQAAVDAGAV